MKTKIILLLSVLLSACYWMACEDIDQIGMGVQPGDDKINVTSLMVDVTGRTLKADSIYANSIYGLLGNFHDEDYGDLKAGYFCQFYPALEFAPEDSILNNQVDSIQLHIYYSTYFGDSLAPMEVTVYPLKTALPDNYYAYTSPEKSNDYLSPFYDKQHPLGKKSYTARDLNISDSLNLANVSSGAYKQLVVKLPPALGQQFLQEHQEGTAFKNKKAIITDFFKGICVLPTFGSSCLLNVERTEIRIYYQRKFAANDSTALGTAVLNVTEEIVQLNSYTGDNEQKLLTPNDNYMYLKTPTGVFSEITIPVSEIKEKMGARKFSNVRLSIEVEPQREDKQYVFPFPGSSSAKTAVNLAQSKLLLIEPDSLAGFLENKRVANNTPYAYMTTYNSGKAAYVFDNISGVVQTAIDSYLKHPEIPENQNLVLRLVPVSVKYYESSSSSSYTTIPVDYKSTNYLAPSAVTLKKTGLKIDIIAVSQQ